MSTMQNKVAVVSGATSGIGAAIARRLCADGMFVIIGGRREAEGTALARELGPSAVFVRADVRREEDVADLIAAADLRFGRLDVLVNNAGGPGHRSRLDQIDLSIFDQAMAVHVRGALACMKYAAPAMARGSGGSIINIASINGLRAGMGSLDYAVAKAALIHLTRCAAVELGSEGIRVNCVSPGPIATPIFAKGMGFSEIDESMALDAAQAAIAKVAPRWQPLARIGLPEDVAEAVAFLAKDEARLITGQNLAVDGGVMAGWTKIVAAEDLAAFRSEFLARVSNGDAGQTNKWGE